MLILQKNAFSGGGLVLLVQAHTTLGKAAIIIMVTSTTIRISVATVEATLGLVGTEMVDLYPTINKAMLQVQVSSMTLNCYLTLIRKPACFALWCKLGCGCQQVSSKFWAYPFNRLKRGVDIYNFDPKLGMFCSMV